MKTIVINADPKRKGINAQLMKSALKGAARTMIVSASAIGGMSFLHWLRISSAVTVFWLECPYFFPSRQATTWPCLKGWFIPLFHIKAEINSKAKSMSGFSEDLLEMLNGEVVIDTFSNISKNMYANKSEEEIRKKEKQLELDLEKVFYTAGRLSSKKI